MTTTTAAMRGRLIFKIYGRTAQEGQDPKARRQTQISDWAYASDDAWDAFFSDISLTREGVEISMTSAGVERFGINVRWNVEGFGFIYLTADNGGEFYTLPPSGASEKLNLNLELARSRVLRNRRRIARHMESGWRPSLLLASILERSEDFYSAAVRSTLTDPERAARLADHALGEAVWAGEYIELEKSRFDILRHGRRSDFFFGCDARGAFEMDRGLFFSRFSELFDYATVTHYLIAGVFEDFEPEEGKKRFECRDGLVRELRERGLTVEGRPLWWSYETTTPEWLTRKSYDEVRRYVERHVRETVSHYGDQMYAWEVVNEFHDWANECRLTPEQITEVTRLACDTVREVNPRVKRLINNCAPFGEYVQMRKMTRLDAFYPQRTPYQFLKALTEAGVEFDLVGVQMYFPYRDIADIALLLEKYRALGKRMQLTEVGASSGPSSQNPAVDPNGISPEPFAWHRAWDEELQADWAESVYTLAYSRPQIEAANWYDFVDPHSWIPNGGLLRSPKGEKRAAFERLATLKAQWNALG